MFMGVMFAQTDDRSALERSLRSYFDNYGAGRSGFPVVANISNVAVDNNGRHIRITLSERFGEQEFTPKIVNNIYSKIKSVLPASYRGYDVKVYTHGRSIDELIPNRLREHGIDRGRQWGNINYTGKPWVTNMSRPNDISRGLEGRHLTIAASHGRYFDQKSGKWTWQRPWSPRERDWQKNEIIIDNDGGMLGRYYFENNGSNKWATAPGNGYARHGGTYTNGENPFRAGTARVAETTSGKQVSQVAYMPDIPAAGRYAVYVSYLTFGRSIEDAEYEFN